MYFQFPHGALLIHAFWLSSDVGDQPYTTHSYLCIIFINLNYLTLITKYLRKNGELFISFSGALSNNMTPLKKTNLEQEQGSVAKFQN